MLYGLTVVSAPAEEPITLAEAKLHLREDDADEDDLIQSLVKAARQHCEMWTGRAFVTQTLRLSLDEFPDVIVLPRPRLQSVTSIQYVDADGVTQTLSASDYRVDTAQEPGRITPAYEASWPVARAVTGAVTVTYVAGYGAAAAVPETVKAAVKLLLAHLYEHREAASETALQELPLGVQALLAGEWVGTYL